MTSGNGLNIRGYLAQYVSNVSICGIPKFSSLKQTSLKEKYTLVRLNCVEHLLEMITK